MRGPNQIFGVSEIAHYLKEVIKSDEVLSDVCVQGEISDLRQFSSGHVYFSLKDANACIRCVMWRRAAGRLERLPTVGQAVLAYGEFSVYEARGEVQLQVSEIQQIGAGLLYERFEALKQRLKSEGLFEDSRKRPLPRYPRRIGIVTSRDGAVLHDICHIIERRYPLPELILAPCLVQGDAAPEQIVAALNSLQRVKGLDVIILARGGGSFEDLFCFNDERLARAIVASRVPVVSGVGHETDFTIADFCADQRAPTPTGAAQLCTPDQNELRASLILCEQRLARSARAALNQARQQIDDRAQGAGGQLRRQLALERVRLNGLQRHLQALDPRATLERGYAIVRREPEGDIVSHGSQVATDDVVRVRVSDGEFRARVE